MGNGFHGLNGFILSLQIELLSTHPPICYNRTILLVSRNELPKL